MHQLRIYGYRTFYIWLQLLRSFTNSTAPGCRKCMNCNPFPVVPFAESVHHVGCCPIPDRKTNVDGVILAQVLYPAGYRNVLISKFLPVAISIYFVSLLCKTMPL